MEKAASLKAMAFDKTGTLTVGRPQVVSIIPATGYTEEELLSAAAALETHSEHPLARAVVKAAKERAGNVTEAHDVEAVTGFGLRGEWNGTKLRLGKVAWFEPAEAWADETTRAAVSAAQSRGETVVILADESRWWGALGIADVLRSSAQAALAELRQLGASELTMLTGDAEAVAKELAGRLGLSYRAGLLPQEKLDVIKSLREQFGPTGMIGDGMNDAPSLAAADVGFSLEGAGTDVALETADVVILAGDLRRLPYAILLARATQRVIQQNLLVAFGVMGTLLVLSLVITLPLPLAVLGHEGSTVAVILNGLRLLRFPRPSES
jgi:Cd2+/Zn2+-exporting ATPase